ncbi:MAG: hypothetical protein IJ092_03220 [Atopobiaceae bacterium]|nr:hypothetical protein [Atopobiaceae bacterium]
MWRCYTMDTMSGALGVPIDIPSMGWTVSISDCSLSTTRDKGVAGYTSGGLELPWTAVPGASREARARELASMRRSIVLMWEEGGERIPVVVGAIGPRVDRWLDTSFELVSMLDLLDMRILVDEGSFGKGSPTGTTTKDIAYRSMSLRGIASDMGRRCTDSKPGGTLPIDWTYVGETGRHDRTYYGYNVSNNSLAKLLEEITNVQGGPDMQLRPYLADETHVRHRLEMGTDAHPALDQAGVVQTLTSFPGGGTLENVEVAHLGPVMRVYGYGAGQDKAMLCSLAEDRTLLEQRDPWPLVEEAHGFTDDSNLDLLSRHSRARLAASSRPVCQVSGDIWLDDARTPGLSDFWPGQLVNVAIEGHPGLPDGSYEMRLMEMSGDQSSQARLTFDVMPDPWEA